MQPNRNCWLVRSVIHIVILISLHDIPQLYPSIQAKVWGNIGKLPELLDVVLDSFIKVKIRLFVFRLH